MSECLFGVVCGCSKVGMVPMCGVWVCTVRSLLPDKLVISTSLDWFPTYLGPVIWRTSCNQPRLFVQLHATGLDWTLKHYARLRTLRPLSQAPTVGALPALPTPRASPRRRITRAKASTIRARALLAPLALQSQPHLMLLPTSGKMASWLKKSTSGAWRRNSACSVANLTTWQRTAPIPPPRALRPRPEQLRLRLPLLQSQKND